MAIININSDFYLKHYYRNTLEFRLEAHKNSRECLFVLANAKLYPREEFVMFDFQSFNKRGQGIVSFKLEYDESVPFFLTTYREIK